MTYVLRHDHLPPWHSGTEWNLIPCSRGEFSLGRRLSVVGKCGANTRARTKRPTPSLYAFGSFRAKRGFSPNETVENKYCKRQSTWIYNDGHYPFWKFRVFYILVSMLLFLCSEINVCYIRPIYQGVVKSGRHTVKCDIFVCYYTYFIGLLKLLFLISIHDKANKDIRNAIIHKWNVSLYPYSICKVQF